ncbi:hypothetical protein ABIE35_003469 [Paenarthrobacter sp. 4246]
MDNEWLPGAMLDSPEPEALPCDEPTDPSTTGNRCSEPGCFSSGRLILGLCGKHYQRLRKHGSTNPSGVQFRDHSAEHCKWKDCGKPVKAKGYCARHYQRFQTHGDPSVTKLRDVDLNQPRYCEHCGSDISHKRSNAVFCSRDCKTKVSDKRRLLDGREQERNQKRYPRERRQRKKLARELYWATRPRQLETSRAWRIANPDKRYAQHINRRGRKFNNPGFVAVTDWEWRRMVRRNGYRCTYCGKRPDRLVMDHVVPLSRGGRHAPGNVTPACTDCNGAKGAMFVCEWKQAQSRNSIG